MTDVTSSLTHTETPTFSPLGLRKELGYVHLESSFSFFSLLEALILIFSGSAP